MLAASKDTVENKIKYLLDPEWLHCALQSMYIHYHTPGICSVQLLPAQIAMMEIPIVACGGSR